MDVVELGTIPHDLLVQWCQRVLGSPPVTRFLETGHLSAVIGVELEDGRRTVIKVREPSERLAACAAIQMTLFRQGFPCAELLAGPEPFGDLVATAESYIPRGEQPPSRCKLQFSRWYEIELHIGIGLIGTNHRAE